MPVQTGERVETSAGTTHLPPLGGLVREQVTIVLQQSLVELIDLGLFGKQLHWNVVGELFRPLHAQLDELVDSWRDLADTVAERLVAIGGGANAEADLAATGAGVA